MSEPNQHRRKFLKAVGATGIAGLAGCSSGDTDSGSQDAGQDTTSTGGTDTGNSGGSPTEIIFMHDRDAAKATINKMVEEFNNNHPDITVKPQLTPSGTGTNEELQKMRAANNPPEIIWFTFGQAYRYAHEGQLAPITDIVKENNLRTFTDSENKYFAPLIVGPITWHYRQDHYDSPKTWADYLQQSKRINEESDITALQIPNGATTISDSIAVQLLWEGGVNIWDGPSDDITLSMATGEDRQLAVEAFQWIKDIYQYASNGNGLTWGEAAKAYQQGSAAAVPYIGQWIPTLYLKDYPEIKKNTWNGFHPFKEGAALDHQFGWYEGPMVWDTENNDAAREFVRFLSSPDGRKRFIGENAGDYIPAAKKDMNADWYRSNAAVHQELLDLFAEHANNIKPPVATGTDGALNYKAVSNGPLFGRATAQLLHGGKSPSQTIDWLQSQINS